MGGFNTVLGQDEDIQKYTLNAKIENGKGKPSFKKLDNKDAWEQKLNGNGLIQKEKSKQKYEIGLPNQEEFIRTAGYIH
jgi:hypothetical protein